MINKIKLRYNVLKEAYLKKKLIRLRHERVRLLMEYNIKIAVAELDLDNTKHKTNKLWTEVL